MPIEVPAASQVVSPYTPGSILQPRSARLGDLACGVVDEFGTEIRVTDVKNWFGGTGTTGQATQREGADGYWLSRANRPGRLPELDLYLTGASWEQVSRSLDVIMTAASLDALTTLTVAEPGYPAMQAQVRLAGDVLVSRAPVGAQVSIPLVAPDPLRYGIDQKQVTMHLPSSSGGLTFPHVFPYSIDATIVSGRETLSNDGNATVYPLLRVNGPATTPTLINATTGERLTYTGTLEAGQYVDLDMSRRTARLNGTASRRAVGSWWGLGRGDTDVTWTSAAYSSAATLTVAWRDAWL